jgi:hypothetical protein
MCIPLLEAWGRPRAQALILKWKSGAANWIGHFLRRGESCVNSRDQLHVEGQLAKSGQTRSDGTWPAHRLWRLNQASSLCRWSVV